MLSKPGAGAAKVVAATEYELMAKVLLIEDDSETAEEIAAELADRGFEVEWAANGIEGLDKARSLRPDAMIVDRLLPGMDGLTVIEALRKDQVRTPVLVLSALGAVDDRVRGLRMGGDDYLTKPFAIVELVARIEALLRRPAESRETTLRVGPLELDLIERTAKRGDRVIDLLLSGSMSGSTRFTGDDLRKSDPKFRKPRYAQYLAAVELLDQFARERFGKRVIHLAARWVLDRCDANIALWGARRADQLAPIADVVGWRIDSSAMAEIDRILQETVKDPVGPEFMAPPDRLAA